MAVAVNQTSTGKIPWWLVLIEGILAVLLGALLLVRPGVTFAVIVQVIAIYWLIAGIFRIVSIFVDQSMWGWKLFAGILGIVAGLVLLGGEVWYSAVLFGVTVTWVIGFFGIVYGVIGLFQAFQGAGWGAAILGVLSIIFGLVLLTNTVIAALALPWVIGVILIVDGIFAIFAAFQFR
jgi:uncharacterized membrane protein HdeD (DUF308 family)